MRHNTKEHVSTCGLQQQIVRIQNNREFTNLADAWARVRDTDPDHLDCGEHLVQQLRAAHTQPRHLPLRAGRSRATSPFGRHGTCLVRRLGQGVTIDNLRRDRDRAAGGRELESVGDQVADDLRQLVLVDVHEHALKGVLRPDQVDLRAFRLRDRKER